MATARARGELDIDIKRWQAGFARAGQSIKSLEKQAMRFGSLALFGTGLGIAAATKLLADFQSEMAKVGALTGATGKDFDKLEANARKLGATTKFSATEAAGGMAFLAQAGFDANEILASSKDFLNLAAAGGLDLAEAMDIASNVMQGFRLSAEESGRAADVLAKTAASSNTDILMLGEAMKKLAPVAAATGISIEDASAAIGVLGNAGIQGEAAGTAMASILLRLVKPTSEVRNGIEALGLTMEELNPVTNSMSTVFGRLSAAMTGVGNDIIAVGAANDIFGKRAVASGLVLKDSVAVLDDLSRANKRAEGTVESLAARMSDNLGGALKSLKSRLEDAALEVGEGGLGEGIEDAVKRATAALEEFVGSGDAANFGAFLRDQIDTALEGAKMLADGMVELRRVVGENRDTIEDFAKALLAAYAVFKGFQLASFIASIAQSTASFVGQTVALGANTAALRANAGAAAANAAAQATMAGAVTKGAAASAGASAAAGSKVGAAFVGGVGKSLTRLGGVFVAAFAGIEIGKLLDNKFGLSDLGADVINTFSGVNREMRKMEKAQFDIADMREKRLQKEKDLREEINGVAARHFKTEDTGVEYAKKKAELAQKRLEITERLRREEEAEAMAAKVATEQAREKVRLEERAKKTAKDRRDLEEMILDVQRQAMDLARDRANEIGNSLRQMISDAERLASSVPRRGSGVPARERSIARQQGSKEVSRLREEAKDVRRALGRLEDSGNGAASEIAELEAQLGKLGRAIATADEEVKGGRQTNGTPLIGNRPSITGVPTNPNARLSGGSEAMAAQRANREAAIMQKEAAMASKEAAKLEASLNEKVLHNVEMFAESIEGFSEATGDLKRAAKKLEDGGTNGALQQLVVLLQKMLSPGSAI